MSLRYCNCGMANTHDALPQKQKGRPKPPDHFPP
jgi:hypothetical protein